MERGDDPLLLPRAPRSCTVFVMTPPNEHTSEGGRDDRGVPYHAETLSSAQVLKKHRPGPLKVRHTSKKGAKRKKVRKSRQRSQRGRGGAANGGIYDLHSTNLLVSRRDLDV